MRYMFIQYHSRPDGKIDEVMTLGEKVKQADWQYSSVILDFKELKVLQCAINGQVGSKDWDLVVSTYYPHYTNIIERLFNENGHGLDTVITESKIIDVDINPNPVDNKE